MATVALFFLTLWRWNPHQLAQTVAYKQCIIDSISAGLLQKEQYLTPSLLTGEDSTLEERRGEREKKSGKAAPRMSE